MNGLALWLLCFDLVISGLTCAFVVRHHHMSVVGPMSAAARIMLAMTDLRSRLDILERIVIGREV